MKTQMNEIQRCQIFKTVFFHDFSPVFFHFTTLEIKGRKMTEGSGQCAKKSLVAATSMF